MTLDDDHLTRRQALQLDRERDFADREAEWREQCLLESPETMELLWAHKHASQSVDPLHLATRWPEDRAGIDRVSFDVDGLRPIPGEVS